MRKIDPEVHARRKQAILAAARACFSEKGLMSVGVAEICTRGGISPGTLYHYFASKDDIIEAVVVDSTRDAMRRIHARLHEGDLLAALFDLEAIVEIWSESWQMSPGLRLEMLAAAERNPRLRDLIAEQADVVRAAIMGATLEAQRAGRLPRTIDPDQLAHFASLSWSGLSIVRLMDRNFSFEAYQAALHVILAPWRDGQGLA